MAKWVYKFEEGSAAMRNLLGGKGCNLAEMTNLACRSAGIHSNNRSLHRLLQQRKTDHKRESRIRFLKL